MNRSLLAGLGAAVSMAALGAAVPAYASFIPIMADGLTYTLTESTINPLEDQFVLGISGINATTDSEGGRYGVQAIAFTLPANYSSASAVGWTLHPGQFGASGSGCDQPGGFFCLQNNSTIPSTSLAANSSLSITFDITLSSGDFSSYVPHMKIDWLGTNNHYDLVSQDFLSGTTPPSSVPEPASLAIFGIGLLGLGLLARRRA